MVLSLAVYMPVLMYLFIFVILHIYIIIQFFITYAVMHDLRLIHTDLKPENILLVSADTIRVHDYKVVPNF